MKACYNNEKKQFLTVTEKKASLKDGPVGHIGLDRLGLILLKRDRNFVC